MRHNEKITKGNCTVYPISVPTSRYNLRSYNFYLIEEAERLILLDSGMDNAECKTALLHTLSENNFSLHDLECIVLTHHHDDHIGLVNWVVRETGVPVYAHNEAIPRLKKGDQYRRSQLEFFKELYREMGSNDLPAQQHLEMMETGTLDYWRYTVEGDIIPLTEGERVGHLRVVETPGHSPDHIALYDEERQWLFSGDHVIQHISSNASIESDLKGNRLYTLVQYVHSLQKCEKLEIELAFPGHGCRVEYLQTLIGQRLERIEEKCATLLRFIREGVSTADQIARLSYVKEYEKQFPLVMSEIIGHLDYMELNHQIRKERWNGIWHYSVS